MPPVKRKRKSRWGSEDDKVQLPIPPIVIPQDINVPDPETPSLSGTQSHLFSSVHVSCIMFNVLYKNPRFGIVYGLTFSAKELSGLGYKKGKPLGLVGVTELSDDQKKQIKEQQEVDGHRCPL